MYVPGWLSDTANLRQVPTVPDHPTNIQYHRVRPTGFVRRLRAAQTLNSF